ncbi:hypothetical protein [Pseudomonas carnis]|uniref:hypothetical protein n=1 Tax=Pseudomonas carnis TaxID=2487355 RepID=UPI001F1FA6C3|nr:hypothetical protein [Pseudomonas carnis]
MKVVVLAGPESSGKSWLAAQLHTPALIKISLPYRTSQLSQILPFVSKKKIGEVPRLPSNLTAQASLQLVP